MLSALASRLILTALGLASGPDTDKHLPLFALKQVPQRRLARRFLLRDRLTPQLRKVSWHREDRWGANRDVRDGTLAKCYLGPVFVVLVLNKTVFTARSTVTLLLISLEIGTLLGPSSPIVEKSLGFGCLRLNDLTFVFLFDRLLGFGRYLDLLRQIGAQDNDCILVNALLEGQSLHTQALKVFWIILDGERDKSNQFLARV